ncbi:unnamed protein product [Calypogeia fissa]
MARGRVGPSRAKIFGFPAMSSMSILCGSALACIAMFSLICGRLLDLNYEDLQHRLGPPPFPFPGHISITTLEEVSGSLNNELQDLQDVPAKGDSTVKNVWYSKSAELYHSCSAASDAYAPSSDIVENGYVTIQASGGLNQQRTGITDSVAVARILNATLIIPELDHASFWNDNSNFEDIFDVDHFISVLAPDVRVVKEVPLDVQKSSPAIRMRVPRKSPPQYYENKVLQKLLSKHVVQLTKFDYRLSNKLEEDLQKLRCRVNYEALRFTQPIARMGQLLVERMRKSGRYIALHLRFEPDMLAFTGCYYGGGPKEIEELGEIRKRWKTLNAPDPERARRNGKCPLSPLEVGLLLRASGFDDDTHLYVASGEVYGGEESLAPLKALFPNFYTKESLSFANELKPFQNYSSRMAAIDYIVCDESDVFVANNNGNMARILAGHRRFNGHKRTIRPNAKKLAPLFLTRNEYTWEQFAEKIRHAQKGFMGDPYEGGPGKGDFHENPAACICNSEGRSLVELAQDPKQSVKQEENTTGKAVDTKWPELEEDLDASENVKVDSEDTVHTGSIGEEVLDSVKEDAKLEAKLEEVEGDENPLFLE